MGDNAMSKDYDDPDKLAEARWRGGEKRSYQDMADYFGCSLGTISLRMQGLKDEIDSRDPSEFEDITLDEEVDDGPTHPLELDLPDDWPPEQEIIDKFLPLGSAPKYIVSESIWGNEYVQDMFSDLLKSEYDLTFEDIITDVEEND